MEEFDCGKQVLTDWLLRHARQAQGSGSARTFVSCDGDRVAGYYSLTVGQIDTLEAPDRVRKGMGQYPIPLIILARLAVDLDYQGRGLGCSLLQDAIHRAITVAEHAGIRAMLPWVDEFLPVHSLASLEALAATLAQGEAPGRRRGVDRSRRMQAR